MADDPIPFVLAAEVESWDPATRVLYVGQIRLEVAPDVVVEILVPKQSVMVTAYRSKSYGGPWVVTGIQVYPPGF